MYSAVTSHHIRTDFKSKTKCDGIEKATEAYCDDVSCPVEFCRGRPTTRACPKDDEAGNRSDQVMEARRNNFG